MTHRYRYQKIESPKFECPHRPVACKLSISAISYGCSREKSYNVIKTRQCTLIRMELIPIILPKHVHKSVLFYFKQKLVCPARSREFGLRNCTYYFIFEVNYNSVDQIVWMCILFALLFSHFSQRGLRKAWFIWSLSQP